MALGRCKASAPQCKLKRPNRQEMTMKTIVSALVALTVLAGVAAPASAYEDEAFNAKTYFDRLQSTNY
jgi:hypothetical protein